MNAAVDSEAVGRRRQELRRLIAEGAEATPEVLAALRAALADADWELRVTAVLLAAQSRARTLRSAVRDVALPSASRFGLDEQDARLLLAIREIAAESLAVPDDEDAADVVEHRLAGVPRELVRRVLGERGEVRDRAGLLLHALTTPASSSEPADASPADIATAWVAALPHLLGDGSAAAPIRTWTPAAGFFIARRPLSVEDLARLGVDVPAAAPLDDATCARLAATPEPPLVLTFDAAVALCERLSRRLRATVTLPTADELEAAARGTDGRRHSWGNGLQRLSGHERSPHGVERFAVPIAQWTSSPDVAMGGPSCARCSGRFGGSSANAVRPVLRA